MDNDMARYDSRGMQMLRSTYFYSSHGTLVFGKSVLILVKAS